MYRFKKKQLKDKNKDVMRTGILCPHRYKIPVHRLMRTSMSAFRLFPTNDPSNKKRWWRFICVDMFCGASASFTTVVHYLHRTTSASNRPSVFHSHGLKCFHRSDFPLLFGTMAYSISNPLSIPVKKKKKSCINHQL